MCWHRFQWMHFHCAQRNHNVVFLLKANAIIMRSLSLSLSLSENSVWKMHLTTMKRYFSRTLSAYSIAMRKIVHNSRFGENIMRTGNRNCCMHACIECNRVRCGQPLNSHQMIVSFFFFVFFCVCVCSIIDFNRESTDEHWETKQ